MGFTFTAFSFAVGAFAVLADSGPPPDPPVNISPPFITPSPTNQGIPVSLFPPGGVWEGGPVLTYQWQVNETDVPGATGTSIETNEFPIGSVIRLKEIATNAGGSAEAFSNTSEVVEPA